MSCVRFLSFLICAVFQICQSANIVVLMPLPYYSHQTAFKPLWLELARRGHHVTLIQSNVIIENNENITQIALNETYNILNKAKVFDNLGEGQSIIRVITESLKTVIQMMEYQIKHPEVEELLKSGKKIDLFFTEYLAPFGFALGRKFNAPMIGLVSMDASLNAHMVMGNPTHPIMFPDKDIAVSEVMTFWDRVTSTSFWLLFKVLEVVVLNSVMNEGLRKCFDDIEPFEDIVKNISLLFINSNPLFNVERPLGPRTINIGGGVHLLEARPLPKDLQDYLDSAENGVVYFSLGSSITDKQLSNKTKKVILETFSQLPYKILWKFDKQLSEKSDNVKIVKWLPQQDVLRHKNIKVFITQGGLQSAEESIYNYVPMIALPFYGDQHSNARQIVNRGFGLILDHKNLDATSFKNAILEAINNPKYKERIKELADLIMDQPMTGLEKAVWWTEYVLRHGHMKPLNSPTDVPWYQFLLLDVISFFILILLTTIFVIVKIVRFTKWLVIKLFVKIINKNKKTKTT